MLNLAWWSGFRLEPMFAIDIKMLLTAKVVKSDSKILTLPN